MGEEHNPRGAKSSPFEAAISRIAESTFGLTDVRVTPLPGDVETNAKVTGRQAGDAGQKSYLLRIFTSGIDRAAIEFQRDLVQWAAEKDAALAPQLQAFEGFVPGGIARVTYMGNELDACLQTFIEGQLMSSVAPQSPALLRDLGATLARLNVALGDFDGAPPPPPTEPGSVSWTLTSAPRMIRERLVHLEDTALRRGLITRVLERVERDVVPIWNDLPQGVVHQDANENNVIVEAVPGGARLAGLIDFGDATRTILSAEPAIACAYAAFGKEDPLTAMGHIVAGYHSIRPLTDLEFSVLFDLALLRLAMSVSVSSERAMLDGGATAYHLVSQAPAWDALEALVQVSPTFATAVFREMSGVPALPRGERFKAWAQRSSFAPIFSEGLADAPFVDLSVGSDFLVGEGASDLTMAAWGAKIESLRTTAGAAAVIGHHDEARRLYASSDSFGERREGWSEPRTIHLGVDLFAPAGTTVFAPLHGTVLSVQRNEGALDYGPTLILEHAPKGEGDVFWTLFGHLDGSVLEELVPGAHVRRGEAIARLGAEHENGGWPPHLHFQVILDRLDLTGDFPGVAAPSRRGVWTAISPDPALLLGLKECSASQRRTEDLLQERQANFCHSMSISYGEPLHIVKGRGTTLLSADGRPFLDAVNNVPHVGHCHPRVVAAGERQMRLLNTNTRYLGEGLLRYASKLRAKLPPHLEVLYFVSSGSEANELALRLARAATDGAPDVLVQEHGYHGHTGATVSSSHYKFAGPGGFETPQNVHVVPIADPFRGEHRGPDSGGAYVSEIDKVLARLRAAGRRPAALLAEAIIGCGGQVVPPAGYLKDAFQAVRDAGGVAIADEVQVGFGRVGTHFWAFDEQGASPDIVTMGKPMGNGHPLAAVATTRAIADRFAGGMEFFATFGGNNVSAAIGEAVLDVIADEELMENARARGAQFFDLTGSWARDFPCVGDVRGRGLYLGVDLVRDKETREPWGEAASYAAERMKQHGILISTDGPFHNVLKIKPPICFTETEMARLVETLARVLSESPLRG